MTGVGLAMVGKVQHFIVWISSEAARIYAVNVKNVNVNETWLFWRCHPLTTLYVCLLIKGSQQSTFLSMTSYSPRPRIHFPTLNFRYGPSLIATCHHSDVMAVSFPNECSVSLVFFVEGCVGSSKIRWWDAFQSVTSHGFFRLNPRAESFTPRHPKHNWWRTPNQNLSLTSSAINMSHHSNLCSLSHIKQ